MSTSLFKCVKGFRNISRQRVLATIGAKFVLPTDCCLVPVAEATVSSLGSEVRFLAGSDRYCWFSLLDFKEKIRREAPTDLALLNMVNSPETSL